MNKAIFINKDGTLIKEVLNNVNPKFVTLNEGVVEGLKVLQAKGYYLILITNQEGIAYGYFKEQALLSAIYRVEELLKFKGVYLDGFMLCPHHPNGRVRKYAVDCDCRRPKPGLLINAAKKYNLDLKNSWILGNLPEDIQAGNLAGCQTILIQTEAGLNGETLQDDIKKPKGIFVDITKAAEFIMAHSQ